MQTFIVVERRGKYARADDRRLGLRRQFIRAHNGRTKHFASEDEAWKGGYMALNKAPGASVIVMAVEG